VVVLVLYRNGDEGYFMGASYNKNHDAESLGSGVFIGFLIYNFAGLIAAFIDNKSVNQSVTVKIIYEKYICCGMKEFFPRLGRSDEPYWSNLVGDNWRCGAPILASFHSSKSLYRDEPQCCWYCNGMSVRHKCGSVLGRHVPLLCKLQITGMIIRAADDDEQSQSIALIILINFCYIRVLLIHTYFYQPSFYKFMTFYYI
jgi:hypothetical protein